MNIINTHFTTKQVRYKSVITPISDNDFSEKYSVNEIIINSIVDPEFCVKVFPEDPILKLNLWRIYSKVIIDANRESRAIKLESARILSVRFSDHREITKNNETDQVSHVIGHGNHLWMQKSIYIDDKTPETFRHFNSSVFPFFGPGKNNEPHLIDISPVNVYQVFEEVFFIGGRPNFGHFLIDHLSLIYFLLDSKRWNHIKFLVFELDNHQRQFFAHLKLLERIIEIPHNVGYTIVETQACWFARDFPILARAKAIRQLLNPIKALETNSKQYPRICFIVRRSKPDIYPRISNLNEVIDYFIRIGADVIHAEEMTVQQKIQFISQYDIVCVAFGSEKFNHTAFGHSGSILLAFSAREYFDPEGQLYYWTTNYLTYAFGRIIFILGQKTNIQNKPALIRHDIDCSRHYSVFDISKAIEAAVRIITN